MAPSGCCCLVLFQSARRIQVSCFSMLFSFSLHIFLLCLPLQNSCAAAVVVAATVGSAAVQGLVVEQEHLLEIEVLLALSLLLSVYHCRCLVDTCTNQATSDELLCTLQCLFLMPFLSLQPRAPIKPVISTI